MAYETYDPKSDPVQPPTESEWQRGKELRGCNCNDPWRLSCTNWDCESITVRGGEACSCGCHRRPTPEVSR